MPHDTVKRMLALPVPVAKALHKRALALGTSYDETASSVMLAGLAALGPAHAVPGGILKRSATISKSVNSRLARHMIRSGTTDPSAIVEAALGAYLDTHAIETTEEG